MKMDEEIDRLLSGEEELAPSSGFTASVMEAVQAASATPPPLPFPWGRALPGLVVAAVVAIAALVSALTGPGLDGAANAPGEGVATALTSLVSQAASAAASSEAVWVLVATLVLAAGLKLGWRLADGR